MPPEVLHTVEINSWPPHELRLKRIALGPVLLGNLKSGKTRRLTRLEVEALRDAAGRRQRVPTHPIANLTADA